MENQVLDNEQVEQTQGGYDEIAFVTKVLDKQFELVGMLQNKKKFGHRIS